MGCNSSKKQVIEPILPQPDHIIRDQVMIPVIPSFSDDLPQIALQDYEIERYLASGGIGVVYLAKNHSNNIRIALKFFGYVKKPIEIDDIMNEINIFHIIKDLKGIVQIKGVCLDTIEGYVPNKVCNVSYPVIGMEYMEGGDLLDRIQSRIVVNEKMISFIFREIILAMNSLHHVGYLHCDLKLENVMFTSPEEDSLIKLIDLGMLVQLPKSGIFYSETGLRGTPGYVAPESLLKNQYSCKSDIWQAGCILYSLLSGKQPFNANRPQQTVNAKYDPMTGIAWESISSAAKDLIKKIFVPEPSARISCDEIFSHEWLRGNAPENKFSESYHQKFHQLTLGQRLKRAFRDQNLLQNTQDIKDRLQNIIPVIRRNQALKRQQSDSDLTLPAIIELKENTADLPPRDETFENHSFQKKMANLKHTVIHRSASRGYSTNQEEQTPLQEVKKCGDVNMNEFMDMLAECDLSELATPEIFQIFDSKHTGHINMKEFLVTMVVFRDTTLEEVSQHLEHPPHSDQSLGESEEMIKFYFHLFDFDQSGAIELEELKLVIRCFCSEHLESTHSIVPPSEEEIETMFEAMNTRHTNQINFDEFKLFYQRLINESIKS